uniref:fibronectin type III domain-containing protein n=1 Tax=Acinetobacter baumannii TaxID=470 RepID=UPI001178CE07
MCIVMYFHLSMISILALIEKVTDPGRVESAIDGVTETSVKLKWHGPMADGSPFDSFEVLKYPDDGEIEYPEN